MRVTGARALRDDPRALEWLALLPFAEPGDLRQWLDECGAFELHGRGVRNIENSATWPLVWRRCSRICWVSRWT